MRFSLEDGLNFLRLFIILLTMIYITSKTVFADEIVFSEKPQSLYSNFSNMSEREASELEQLVYYESIGCYDNLLEVRMAIVQTVFNRVMSQDFPDNVHDVIFQDNQFFSASCLFEKKLSDDDIESVRGAIENVINGEMVLPNRDYLYFSEIPQSCATMHIFIGRWSESFHPIAGTGLFFGRAC